MIELTMITCNKYNGYKPKEEDFIEFSRQIHESWDIDPVYPVLEKYFELNNYTPEEKLFGIHVYLTYYNTYWAILTLERLRGNFNYDSWRELDFVQRKDAKFGSDRRGIRANGLNVVLPMFKDFLGEKTQSDYYLSGLHTDPKVNYEIMKERVLKVPHNGSWAGYKHIDLLTYCGGFPIECTDWWVKGRAFGGKQLVVDWEIGMGEQFKLGKTLKETPEIVTRIEDFADRWTRRLQTVIGSGIVYDKSETMACKFHALYGNNYYAGHDIDKMQEEICGYDKKVDELMYSLREMVFDKRHLGEHNGWKGVRKELKGTISKEIIKIPVSNPVPQPKGEAPNPIRKSVKRNPIRKSRPLVSIRQPIRYNGESRIMVIDPYNYLERKMVNRSHPVLIEERVKNNNAPILCDFPVEPFHYREKKRHATQNAMEKCVEHNIPIAIETRQEIPEWALNLLSRHRFSEVRIQLNTLKADSWTIQYPDSPAPEELMKNFVNCFNRGIYTVLKIAPIVPVIVQPVDVFRCVDAVRNWTENIEVCFASFSEEDFDTLKERVPEHYEEVFQYYHVIGDRWYVKGSYREEFLRKLDAFTTGWKLKLKTLNEVVEDEFFNLRVLDLKSKK